MTTASTRYERWLGGGMHRAARQIVLDLEANNDPMEGRFFSQIRAQWAKGIILRGGDSSFDREPRMR